MIVRRERPDDVDAVAAVTAAAFADAPHSAPPVQPGGPPGEVTLLSWLRADPAWLPRLSWVATVGDEVGGHAVATRATVGGAPALGLGPVSVRLDHQRAGVGTAVLHALLGAADALDEPLVALLGDPTYYGRFGFVSASSLGVEAPEPAWGDFFQVRPLTSYDGRAGRFAYAPPFDRL